MLRWILLFLVSVSGLSAENVEQKEKLDEIDHLLWRLSVRKNRYLTSAMCFTAKANWMQFYNRFTLDARFERRYAEREVRKAELAQEKIDILNKMKEKILKGADETTK